MLESERLAWKSKKTIIMFPEDPNQDFQLKECLRMNGIPK